MRNPTKGRLLFEDTIGIWKKIYYSTKYPRRRREKFLRIFMHIFSISILVVGLLYMSVSWITIGIIAEFLFLTSDVDFAMPVQIFENGISFLRQPNGFIEIKDIVKIEILANLPENPMTSICIHKRPRKKHGLSARGTHINFFVNDVGSFLQTLEKIYGPAWSQIFEDNSGMTRSL